MSLVNRHREVEEEAEQKVREEAERACAAAEAKRQVPSSLDSQGL